MKKKLLTVVIAALTILSIFMLVACGGNPNNNSTNTNAETESNTNQLALVQNIKYDEDNYKITWDKVSGADSYNVKVTTDNVTIENIKMNELEFYPKNADKKLSIEIQAVDSTGTKEASKWSTAYSYTLTKTDTLMANIMDYAKANVKGSLQKFVSATKEVDKFKGNDILVMKVISINNKGERFVTLIKGRVEKGTDATSLNTIVKSNPKLMDTIDHKLAVNKNGEVINSMNFLLASDITKKDLHTQYIAKGYKVDVVSSYTSIDSEYDTVGKDFTVHGVLKLTRDAEVKYASVDYVCSLKGENIYTSLEDNVTNGFTRDHSLTEGEIQLLSGDFIEASTL